MDFRDCECGGYMGVTYTATKDWGVYRIRTCNRCGKKLRTGEVYNKNEHVVLTNQRAADRRNMHAKEYYWENREARLKYNHEYYKAHRDYYIKKGRERYRRICEEKRKQEEKE